MFRREHRSTLGQTSAPKRFTSETVLPRFRERGGCGQLTFGQFDVSPSGSNKLKAALRCRHGAHPANWLSYLIGARVDGGAMARGKHDCEGSGPPAASCIRRCSTDLNRLALEDADQAKISPQGGARRSLLDDDVRTNFHPEMDSFQSTMSASPIHSAPAGADLWGPMVRSPLRARYFYLPKAENSSLPPPKLLFVAAETRRFSP